MSAFIPAFSDALFTKINSTGLGHAVVGSGTVIQAGRLLVRFLMKLLGFHLTLILQAEL
jgi:hypothetical protein